MRDCTDACSRRSRHQMPPKMMALCTLVATRSFSAARSRVTCFQLRLKSMRSCSGSGGGRCCGGGGCVAAAARTASSVVGRVSSSTAAGKLLM